MAAASVGFAGAWLQGLWGEAESNGNASQFSATANAGLVSNSIKMRMHGLHADVQLGGNLIIGSTLCDEGEHFTLTIRQRSHQTMEFRTASVGNCQAITIIDVTQTHGHQTRTYA
jgi:hypothetical protein